MKLSREEALQRMIECVRRGYVALPDDDFTGDEREFFELFHEAERVVFGRILPVWMDGEILPERPFWEEVHYSGGRVEWRLHA